MSHTNGKVYGMNIITPMNPWKTWILRLIFFLLGALKSKQLDPSICRSVSSRAG